MQRTRVVAAAAASIAAAVGVAACGGDDGGSGGGGGGGTKKVVYVPGLTGNPFYTTVGCGAKALAPKLNVKFSVQGASEFDVAKQTGVVNAVAASKPDAIMISITDPKGLIAPLKIAEKSGIKIVTVDGDLADTGVGVTNIQSNNKQGGQLAGEKMAKLMKGKGSVLAINNRPGVPTGDDRVNGFKEAIAKYPGIKYLGVRYSDNDVTKAASFVTATAAGRRDLGGVFAAETNNTEGALTGVREAKRQGKVHIVGYDSSDPIVAALRAGKLDGAVVQYPYGEGQTGLQAAVDAIDGKKVPRTQGAPFVVATPDNVDSPKVKKFLYSTECK